MTKKNVNEGLGELADAAEKDHEVQMARADCYKIAKYAIQLHGLLQKVTETEGLEGWQQAKITKAAEFITSVHDSLEYDEKVTNGIDPVMDIAMKARAAKESADPYKSKLHSTLKEKAKSKAQQRFMGMVHAAQKGEEPASPEVAKVAKDMKKSDAKDFASTKHKGKPEHVGDK